MCGSPGLRGFAAVVLFHSIGEAKHAQWHPACVVIRLALCQVTLESGVSADVWQDGPQPDIQLTASITY